MAVTTIIDIEFYTRRAKRIEVEERVVVPVGHRIIWRFNIADQGPIIGLPKLNIEMYFEGRSPFGWQNKNVNYLYNPLLNRRGIEIASETAEAEGEYKYGIRVRSEGQNNFNYDEDPFLIIRRF